MLNADLIAKIETAAIAEAAEACERIISNVSTLAQRVPTLQFPEPSVMLARAKPEWLGWFRADFARVHRVVIDIVRDDINGRAEFLEAVVVYSNAARAEVARRFDAALRLTLPNADAC